MEFGLRGLGLGSSRFVPLSEDQFATIRAAHGGLIEAIFLEEKFDLVIDNYLEFETCLLETTARHMMFGNQDYQLFQFNRSLFNRRLVNLLSVCKSYVDGSKHHINAMLPGNQDALDQLNARFSKHYDSCLGYRVMEALRNFVQHRGFPIHAVDYLGERKDGRIQFVVLPHIKTAYLHADDKFKSSVLKELDSLGGRVNVKPLVGDYISALGDAHQLVRTLLEPQLDKWDRSILEAIELFKPPEISENSFFAAVSRDGDRTIETVQLSDKLIEYRKVMARKNSNLSTIGKRYVTGDSTGNQGVQVFQQTGPLKSRPPE